MSVTVILNVDELALCKEIAELRNQKSPRTSRKISDKLSELDVHLLGVTAEFAVAKALGLKMDAEFKYGDGGVDLVSVQKLLGHSSPTTTSLYDRRNDMVRRKACRVLNVPYIKRP